MKVYSATPGKHNAGITRSTSLPKTANNGLITVIVGDQVNRRCTSDTAALLRAVAVDIEDELRTDSL